MVPSALWPWQCWIFRSGNSGNGWRRAARPIFSEIHTGCDTMRQPLCLHKGGNGEMTMGNRTGGIFTRLSGGPIRSHHWASGHASHDCQNTISLCSAVGGFDAFSLKRPVRRQFCGNTEVGISRTADAHQTSRSVSDPKQRTGGAWRWPPKKSLEIKHLKPGKSGTHNQADNAKSAGAPV